MAVPITRRCQRSCRRFVFTSPICRVEPISVLAIGSLKLLGGKLAAAGAGKTAVVNAAASKALAAKAAVAGTKLGSGTQGSVLHTAIGSACGASVGPTFGKAGAAAAVAGTTAMLQGAVDISEVGVVDLMQQTLSSDMLAIGAAAADVTADNADAAGIVTSTIVNGLADMSTITNNLDAGLADVALGSADASDVLLETSLLDLPDPIDVGSTGAVDSVRDATVTASTDRADDAAITSAAISMHIDTGAVDGGTPSASVVDHHISAPSDAVGSPEIPESDPVSDMSSYSAPDACDVHHMEPAGHYAGIVGGAGSVFASSAMAFGASLKSSAVMVGGAIKAIAVAAVSAMAFGMNMVAGAARWVTGLAALLLVALSYLASFPKSAKGELSASSQAVENHHAACGASNPVRRPPQF